ncbi:MAG TPA: hypothetical protein DIT07_12495 [Sphingobacteriaceae bacterium]|nr:hypothetical protein [Sphingobacteriaceae bacterium]
MTVENMVKYSIDCWGSGEYEILKQNNQPHEAGLLKLDISKSLSMLSWEPKLTAVDSLTLTIDWYKEFHQSFTNINLYTENQITNYLNRYDE